MLNQNDIDFLNITVGNVTNVKYGHEGDKSNDDMKLEKGIWIEHNPTGIKVIHNTEKSQYGNYSKCKEMLTDELNKIGWTLEKEDNFEQQEKHYD